MTKYEAILTLESHRKYMTKSNPMLNKHYIVKAIDMAIEALSADRPQGEWIRLIEYVPESNESLINFDGYQCSVCGGKLWVDGFNFWNYCPNCGACMNTPKGFVADEWYREEFGEEE